MQLPGGLFVEGRRNQAFTLKQADGDLNVALHQLATDATHHPQWVDEALLLVLKTLGDQKPSLEQVQSLCIADRQAIAVAWRLQQNDRPTWLSQQCSGCHEWFDVCIPLADLPCKPAGESFPFATVEIDQQSVQCRVPNGHDLNAIATIDDDQLAMETLAKRLIVESHQHDENTAPTLSDETDFISSNHKTSRNSKTTNGFIEKLTLSQQDIDAIEAAVEAQSPEFTHEIQTVCPECGMDNNVSIDPYEGLTSDIDDLLDEVHVLASHYHWQESAILQLSDQRRKAYLNRINRDYSTTKERP